MDYAVVAAAATTRSLPLREQTRRLDSAGCLMQALHTFGYITHHYVRWIERADEI